MSAAKKADPLAALAALSPDQWSRSPGICAAGRLSASDETFRYLVDESGHPATRISQASKEAGIRISGETITKHRRRACSCPAK